MKKPFLYPLLLAYLAATLLPMLWLVVTSFKPSREIFLDPFAPPSQLALENYSRAWTVGHFGAFFGNSLIITTVTVLLTLVLSAMAAYALTRFGGPYSRLLLLYFLAGMMVPIQMAVVPLFFEMKWLGLLNTRTGLTLVYLATSLPFAVFLLAGFFRALPGGLREAALLDGASEWQTFWHVMLPLARPGLVTVAIFTFLGVWNEYLVAFMLLNGHGSQDLRTLPLGLANLTIVSQFRTDYGMVFAGLVIVMVPTLIVYVLLERHLTRGITVGAMKG
ncbi:MAG: carbohydrate ABC transporter permease [Vulcanimicrobiota bacterium]